MARTLAELASLVAGTLHGDGSLLITNAVPLSLARPGTIALVDHSEKSRRQSLSTQASALLVPRGYVHDQTPLIQVDDIHEAFTKIVLLYRPQRPKYRAGIHPQAYVSPSAFVAHDATIMAGAVIGDRVTVGAGCVIHGGVQIGADSRLDDQVVVFPSAVLYEQTIVGARSIIHAGCVIGAYGFGYKLVNGRHQLSAQLGYVEIGADVEIGANTTIDRGTYGATVIGEGTKIDNQVMIAHNCQIGRHNLICSQVGIAGSTSTGDYVVMAGQVGVRDHVHIGARAVLGAKSGVSNDIPDDAHFLGIPATPEREQKLKMGILNKLPELRQQVKALTAAIAELQRQQLPGADQAAA